VGFWAQKCCTDEIISATAIRSASKMTDIFDDFNNNWSNLADFYKSPQYQISPKNCPVSAVPTFAVRSAKLEDVTKLTGAIFIVTPCMLSSHSIIIPTNALT